MGRMAYEFQDTQRKLMENEKLYRVYNGEKFLGLGSKNDKGFKITKLLIT